jgi:hypothetical protein
MLDEADERGQVVAVGAIAAGEGERLDTCADGADDPVEEVKGDRVSRSPSRNR